ncbi:MAG TPA: response regulator [Ktedonobacterales bacterium]
MYPEVLIIETDAPRRDALQRTLEEAGYPVSVAADRDAALAVLHLNLTRKRPHRLVVLLDHTLPDLDGVEMLRTMTEDPHLATHHAYVLITVPEDHSFTVPEDVLACLTASVLPRPFTPDVLLGVVAQAANSLGMGSEGTGRRD